MNKIEERIKKNKERFLETLALPTIAGNALVACNKIGISRANVYDWRKEDPEFAKKWDSTVEKAKEHFADEAENSLRVLVVNKLNPTSVIFALKNLRPQRWRDKYEHEGADGGPIKHTHVLSEGLQKTLERVLKRLNEKSNTDK